MFQSRLYFSFFPFRLSVFFMSHIYTNTSDAFSSAMTWLKKHFLDDIRRMSPQSNVLSVHCSQRVS
jgi:hypothetical protein